MRKITCNGLVFFVVLLGLSSCNKLDPIPTDRFTDATFWQSVSNAELMVNMAYNQMYSADKMLNDEALSDNIFEGRNNTDQRAIRNGTADPTLGRFASEWTQAYEGLKTCHVFLANIDKVPEMDAALKNRRIAEIRFIRSFIYFRLVNFYGDVPFFTTDISLEESYRIARTPKATIMQFIHDELEAVAAVLPSKNGLANTDNGRITRAAAIAFQARAYLYESNWEQVVAYCDSLMNQQDKYGAYNLFANYAGLFTAANEYNNEVILDYSYMPSLKMWSRFYDMAPLSTGARLNAYAPVQSVVDNYLTLNGLSIQNDPAYVDNNPYVNRDPRLAASVVFHGGQWQKFDNSLATIYIKPGTGSNDEEKKDLYTGASSNASPTGYYLKKYYDSQATQNFDSGLNIIMFRYADILLMYAEAKLALGSLDAETWNKTIRPIRTRAGFTAVSALAFPTGLSASALQQIVRQERRSELAFEGLRYYDIIRWKAGKTYLEGDVLGAKFVNSNSAYIRLDNRRFDENKDYLWSVPISQMDINKNLMPNNPGYAN